MVGAFGKQDTAMVVFEVVAIVYVKFRPGTKQVIGDRIGYQPVFILVFGMAHACETAIVVRFAAIFTALDHDPIQNSFVLPLFPGGIAEVSVEKTAFPI